jgi:hypothetical protein
MNDMTMMVIETSFLAKENDCRRILIDLSEAAMIFPPEQFGALLDSYAECAIPSSTHTALVVSPLDMPKNLSGLVAAAREYGYWIEILTDRAQIDPWLLDTGE